MAAYLDLLARVADRPSLAGFRWPGGELLAWNAPVRSVRSWDELRGDRPLLVCLPYGFPAVPGRAWDVAAGSHHDFRTPGPRNFQTSGNPTALTTPQAVSVRAAWSGAEHAARVRQAQAAIAEGLVYELNIACRWDITLAPSLFPDAALHAALLTRDPAQYVGLFRGGDGPAVVGNSPELFLDITDGVVRSKPIKGTRQRIPGHEPAVRAELDANAKERAELAMIVDLMRHDLGRVAVPGGVRVVDPGSVIDLPRLHHRVATVEAQLRPGLGPIDALAAAYPAGSITGAPKRAAMQHIARLEGGDRGVWCGAYGLIHGSQCELAVAIRTVEISGTSLVLRAGGGIVADSDPEAEWREAQAKARGIADVIGAEV
ncbi:MAG: chorismate-binding protein [Planctomycetota bacterium]